MPWLRTWSDLSLRAKGLIVVAIPAAATVAIACGSLVIENRATAAGQAADEAMRVIEASQELKSSAMETSAHIRAYFISADDAFLVQGGQDMARFDDALDRMAKLVAGNPELTRKVIRVRALHNERVNEVRRAAARFVSGSLAKEQMSAILKGNEARITEQRGILNSIEASERALREAMRAEALRSSGQLRAATLVLGLLGLIGGALASILFAAGISRRIEKLRRNVARLRAGQPLEPLPPSSDEIGALGEGLAIAAAMLAQRAAAVENALHGIAQADAAGRYVSFNKAFGELLRGEEASAPASIEESVHPDDWWKVAGALERMRLSGRAETEARMVRGGGDSINVGLTLIPLPEAHDSGCYVFLRDITRQKEVESALVRAKNAALAANRTKTEFLAKVSHDIRTPLNAILGAADLLSHTALDAHQSEYVGLFQRNCRRLVSLINDFLDFSRIEAGMVKVENVPFRVRETAEDAVAIFRETALRKGVGIEARVDSGVPEWVLGDPARVQQILVNLLSNALKFTAAGQVGLKVSTGGGRLQFEVSDTGPGIAPEYQESIFAAFIQLPNQSPGEGRGAGLGLAICKELLDLMEGEIGVTSEHGRGSTFHFSLPLVGAGAGPAGSGRAVEPPALQWPEDRGPARILIAEDTDDNRLLLAAYLRDVPVEVRFAVNGRQAVDAVRTGDDFDLILMDIDMPKMDGYQAAAAIRNWQLAHGVDATPIVALSAHAMQDAVSASLEAGCVAHVAKPVDRNTLLGAILGHARNTPRKPRAPAAVPIADTTLASRYLATKPAQIQQARDCLAIRDFAEVRRFGHNLKGTGSGYGFSAISTLGLEIEQAAAEGDTGRITGRLDALSGMIDRETRNAAASPERH